MCIRTACIITGICMVFCLLSGCNISSVKAESKESSNMSGNAATDSRNISLDSNTFMINDKTVSFIGRHYLDVYAMAYGFANSDAGVEFAFKGTSLELYLSSTAYVQYTYNYVCVYIDNRDPVVLCVDHEGWQTAAEGLDKNTLHSVRILKRSEANAGAVLIHNARISEGGRLYRAEPAKTNRRIQVLGDSITCGYGTLWDKSVSREVTKWEDGTNTYATMTADYFGASLENICISGIGVGNDTNKPYPLLPNYKKQDNFVEMDCDFSLFVPDVIVIELGTNDYGQQNSHDEFIENATELVDFIRSKYPKAYIVWYYGTMGSLSYCSTIQDAVDGLKAKGDTRISFLRTTPPTAAEGYGLYGHPSLAAHKRMANELITCIEKLTGWKKV